MSKEKAPPRLAIVTAWKPEFEAIHQILNKPTQKKDGASYTHGTLHGVPVVLFESGVGMLRAALSTTHALHQYPTINHVLVAGVAGGVEDSIEPTTVVIPERWRDHAQLYAGQDQGEWAPTPFMDEHLVGLNFGMIHPMNLDLTNPDIVETSGSLLELARGIDHPKLILRGTGLSADIFFDNPDYRRFLQAVYPGLVVVDMETYAIFLAAKEQGRGSIALRAVSDTAGAGNNNEIGANLAQATSNLTKVVDLFVARYATTE